MKPLSRLKGIAAPLLENAIDTDVIFPARFLLILEREGLGRYAFNERRAGNEPFVLDVPPYDKAEILVTGENFGTGSSREQAVWALADLGIRCVIARSFGEIFFANCFKNGVLPIRLDNEEIGEVENAAIAGEEIEVDLAEQTITPSSGRAIGFDVEPYRKRALMAGLDEVGMILSEDAKAITEFEKCRAERAPWLEIPIEKFGKLSRGKGIAE
jgi:3-isopropylmalate dehydratase small subunit